MNERYDNGWPRPCEVCRNVMVIGAIFWHKHTQHVVCPTCSPWVTRWVMGFELDKVRACVPAEQQARIAAIFGPPGSERLDGKSLKELRHPGAERK